MGFGLKATTGIIAGVLVTAALAQASKVFAPLAAALFIIAIVWPIQKRLQSWIPELAALAITIVVTVAICLGFASLAAWGFGRVGRSLVADLPRYQAFYSATVTWLDGHGISVAGLWAEHFNVGWLLRATQQVTTRVNTTLSFWVIALIYVMLGLLEVENIRKKIERLDNPAAARKMGEAILNKAGLLASFPQLGKVFCKLNRKDVREISAVPYRIIYHVKDSGRSVSILTVWHGARQEPRIR
jgi:predicted PurR-regulated permease PerM